MTLVRRCLEILSCAVLLLEVASWHQRVRCDASTVKADISCHKIGIERFEDNSRIVMSAERVTGLGLEHSSALACGRPLTHVREKRAEFNHIPQYYLGYRLDGLC
ncbi:hypothetical protein BJ878DRAFT_490109 [Calycina marina]|uniref:Secreted protein n=1 Tax=Calycina marina TaxID=1763456 RepID=A0A9P7ZAP4_9HELO|nr:hypothetical protein BJ878DRAFT_490109 [Calycina marina]